MKAIYCYLISNSKSYVYLQPLMISAICGIKSLEESYKVYVKSPKLLQWHKIK